MSCSTSLQSHANHAIIWFLLMGQFNFVIFAFLLVTHIHKVWVCELSVLLPHSNFFIQINSRFLSLKWQHLICWLTDSDVQFAIIEIRTCSRSSFACKTQKSSSINLASTFKAAEKWSQLSVFFGELDNGRWKRD